MPTNSAFSAGFKPTIPSLPCPASVHEMIRMTARRSKARAFKSSPSVPVPSAFYIYPECQEVFLDRNSTFEHFSKGHTDNEWLARNLKKSMEGTFSTPQITSKAAALRPKSLNLALQKSLPPVESCAQDRWHCIRPWHDRSGLIVRILIV